MLGLPKSTEFNKRIPKQKFYENIAVTPAMKKAFVEQIRIIYWRNKIATTTLNLAAGGQVTEIEVFEVRLSAPELDESVLRQIDREIPYHILFLLEYEGKYRAVIGYKEAARARQPLRLTTIILRTGWTKTTCRCIWKGLRWMPYTRTLSVRLQVMRLAQEKVRP